MNITLLHILIILIIVILILLIVIWINKNNNDNLENLNIFNDNLDNLNIINNSNNFNYYNPSILYYNNNKYISLRKSIIYYSHFKSNKEFVNKNGKFIINFYNDTEIISNNKKYLIKDCVDARLFIFKNKLYGTCNNEVFTPESYKCFMNLFHIDDYDNIIKVKLNYNKMNKNMEKNWIPIIKNENLYFIYSLIPYVLLNCNYKTGKCVEVYNDNNIRHNKFLSGGPVPISYIYNNKNYLLGIYHYFKYINNHRKYFHGFYLLNNDYPFNITKITKEFIFPYKTNNNFILTNNNNYSMFIQFCTSLYFKNNNIYIGYGLGDLKPIEICIKKQKIDNILTNYVKYG